MAASVTAWLLGLAFTAGMLLADGANGLWIARLLRRADQRARIASRVMGLMVAAISFAVAGFGLARWLHADISASGTKARNSPSGCAVVGLLGGSFVLGNCWRAATPPPRTRTA
jgi:high-affinity nickel-transport protein